MVGEDVLTFTVAAQKAELKQPDTKWFATRNL